ncbi:hypothetical protein [Aquamicrobium sp. LC103]|uniref:hypothetical protein n=1 Tax=Aquamicrobium sp. LC103 TaxID=1120658 RepID=UPI00063EA8AE|nr:hypothetical protein [Aquamicrobium sp. LC103]TKT80016.1 hypothetical protein XW59_006550 [Aquamicrobium sp. LC103]
MTITIELSTDERLALRRFANENGRSLEDAAAAALRDWLIGTGYLEMLDEMDEGSEVAGSA